MIVNKKGFILYEDWAELITGLTDKQKGELLTAIFEYHRHGVVFESVDPALQGIFNFMKSRFDDDKQKYIKRCKQNKENVEKRYAKTKVVIKV